MIIAGAVAGQPRCVCLSPTLPGPQDRPSSETWMLIALRRVCVRAHQIQYGTVSRRRHRRRRRRRRLYIYSMHVGWSRARDGSVVRTGEAGPE
eukprot:COSAG01_NODE_77_length_28297_cov_104.096230_26_plen_93_part_00